MNARTLFALALTLSGCASRDIDLQSGASADAAAEVAPAPDSMGVLLSGFDPESAAPTSSTDREHHVHHGHGSDLAPKGAGTEYTCPHHPEVRSDKPGVCPKCKMDLVPSQPRPKAEPEHDHGARP